VKQAPSTTPGYRNAKGQIVVGTTGAQSTSRLNQTIYRLRCTKCQHEYGANGIDIKDRCCPLCQNGEKGEPLREAAPMLSFPD